MPPPTWTSLILPVKQLIVDKLDYRARCNLKLCSHNDKLLVDSVKYTPYLITFQREAKKIILKYEDFEKKFNDSEAAVSFIEKRWCQNGVIEANKVSILNCDLPPNWIIKCSHLELRMLGPTNLAQWLQNTIPNLKTLTISEWGVDSSISNCEQVRSTRHFLKISRDVMVSDEQLASFQSPSLALFLDPNSRVTEGGVRRVFKKYIENCHPKRGFEIKFPNRNGGDESLMSHRALFDKSWKVEQNERIEKVEGFYMYRILGGFSNVNGIEQFSQVVVLESPTWIVLKVNQ